MQQKEKQLQLGTCVLAPRCYISAVKPGKDLLAKQPPCPLLAAHPPSPGTSAPAAGTGQVFSSSVLLPSLPQNEHSKPRQLAKSSLPASPMHADSHLSYPAVVEPGLRASLRRIHAPQIHQAVCQQGANCTFSGHSSMAL